MQISSVMSMLFERDIKRVMDEINAYTREEDMWITKQDISNSGGNLCLHLIGNLNHFIGATLGNTGYIRERDLEFSSKNISKEKILHDLEEVSGIVTRTLNSLSNEDFAKPFPLEKHFPDASTLYVISHLLSHLDYHLGQINYHRRLIASIA